MTNRENLLREREDLIRFFETHTILDDGWDEAVDRYELVQARLAELEAS